MASKISVHCASITGRRAENQDACWSAAYGSPRGCVRAAIVVSDGMGGALGGARASRIAVDTLRRRIESKPPSLTEVEPWLADSFAQAHDAIVEAGADPSLQGMGCTLVVVLAVGGEAIVAHVGDSRAHMVRPRESQLLTRDHSAVQDAIDRGLYTADEVGSRPEVAALASALTRHLGEGGAPTPDIVRIPFHAGTAMVACTDGLTGSVVRAIVSEAELVMSVCATRGLQEAARRLLALAYRKGSTDNITVAIMEKGRIPRAVRGVPRRALARILGVVLVAGIAATIWVLRPEIPFWRSDRDGIPGDLVPIDVDTMPSGQIDAEGQLSEPVDGVSHPDTAEIPGPTNAIESAYAPKLEVKWSTQMPEGESGHVPIRHDVRELFLVVFPGSERPRVDVHWSGHTTSSKDVTSSMNERGIGTILVADLGLVPGKEYTLQLRATAGGKTVKSEERRIKVAGQQ